MRWMWRLLVVILLLLVLAFGLLFALQNAVEVPVDLLVLQLSERPLATWLILSFALGGIAGQAAGSFALLRLQASRAQLKRRLDHCEKQLSQAGSQLAQP
jgi:uncharacterized integral membrane protein